MKQQTPREPQVLLHTSKCRLTDDGRLEVYTPRLATKLNRYLKYYDDGKYVFKVGEEALFKLAKEQVQNIVENFLTKRRSTETRKSIGEEK